MPTATINIPISAMDPIHQRRSVRSYTALPVDEATMHRLIDAAVRAPTAMDQKPWAFVIIQEAGVLDRLSHSVKECVHEEAKGKDSTLLYQQCYLSH